MYRLLLLLYFLPIIYIETKLEIICRPENEYFKIWIIFILVFPIILIQKLVTRKNCLKILIFFNFLSFLSNYIFYYLIESYNEFEKFRTYIKVMTPEFYFFIFSIIYFIFQYIILIFFKKLYKLYKKYILK